MDRTERFYKIDQILNERRVVPIEIFLERLGVSRATFKRDLEYMRDRLNAPIVWDAAARGYRFGDEEESSMSYSLPGMWLNSNELHALLAMRKMLSSIQPPLLGRLVEPLIERVRALVEDDGALRDEAERRISVVVHGARAVEGAHFEAVCRALLERQQITVHYFSRATQEETVRGVSPQRLMYYRDNWYLDGWCHLRDGLRSFAVDSLRSVVVDDTPARDVPDATLDAELGAGYGIFGGARTRVARLRFGSERARWVADENWHPKQRGWYGDDGRYYLEVPFSDHRELLMDLLKHGAEVEVLKPQSLRRLVAQAHRDAANLYDGR
ncbi:MAG: WYL domain-containing protein [Gammaproteobacteria bacterium]|nr:WYL domain-containing protein [Gammaproteobacteria bacterium]